MNTSAVNRQLSAVGPCAATRGVFLGVGVFLVLGLTVPALGQQPAQRPREIVIRNATVMTASRGTVVAHPRSNRPDHCPTSDGGGASPPPDGGAEGAGTGTGTTTGCGELNEPPTQLPGIPCVASGSTN